MRNFVSHLKYVMMSRHRSWSLTLVHTGPIVSMALLEFWVQLLMLTVEPFTLDLYSSCAQQEAQAFEALQLQFFYL